MQERTGLAKKDPMQRIYNTPSDACLTNPMRSAICVPGSLVRLATDGAQPLRLEREAIDQPHRFDGY